MPYVIQDQTGNIVALSDQGDAWSPMWLAEDDPAVVAFMQRRAEDTSKSSLEQSDLDLIRVIEDLTDLLIKKQVFTFTELPLFVQQKLGIRQKMREDMVSLKSLLNDENETKLL